MSHRFLNPHRETAFSKDPSGKSQARIKDEAHLAFIRKLPSILSGLYGCEAAHIRYGDPKHRKPKTAKGRKPDDCYAVPLTPDEHREQHSMSERDFWSRRGIDPIQIALDLYDVSGNVPAGIETVKKMSAERVRR